jgi:hypothetical protein
MNLIVPFWHVRKQEVHIHIFVIGKESIDRGIVDPTDQVRPTKARLGAAILLNPFFSQLNYLTRVHFLSPQ